jgi:putative transposase
MDGKGRWASNVFVERLWRGVKYEEVYLKAYESIGDTRDSLDQYFTFDKRQTPDGVYYQNTIREAA